MQLIFDNIVATMIGTAVILIMMAAHQRNQVAAAESTAFYMLQNQVNNFTGTVQRDMQNLSSVVDVTETDSVFRFFAQTDQADTTKRAVTYRRKAAGVRKDEDGNLRTLYQIERLVDGNMAGGSIATIATWSIQALNEDEAPIASPADAAAVKVRLVAVPPIEVTSSEDFGSTTTQWQATFRPQLLRGREL